MTVGPIVMMVGSFIGNVVDFLIIAVVVFIIMKQLEKSPVK